MKNGIEKFLTYRFKFIVIPTYKDQNCSNDFYDNTEFNGGVNEAPRDSLNGNNYSQYNIPTIMISEQLSPLIGIDMTFKNGITARFDYKKTRSMAVNFTDYQMIENNSETYTLGIGYRIKGLKLPIKIKKTKIRHRYFDYFILSHNNKYQLQQRLEKDIWNKLYQFPLMESESFVEEKNIMKTDWWNENIPEGSQITNIKTAKIHKLSHQHIHARFWYIKTPEKTNIAQCINVAEDRLESYAVPKLIADYLP